MANDGRHPKWSECMYIGVRKPHLKSGDWNGTYLSLRRLIRWVSVCVRTGMEAFVCLPTPLGSCLDLDYGLQRLSARASRQIIMYMSGPTGTVDL